jgi:hypothetical protein
MFIRVHPWQGVSGPCLRRPGRQQSPGVAELACKASLDAPSSSPEDRRRKKFLEIAPAGHPSGEARYGSTVVVYGAPEPLSIGLRAHIPVLRASPGEPPQTSAFATPRKPRKNPRKPGNNPTNTHRNPGNNRNTRNFRQLIPGPP